MYCKHFVFIFGSFGNKVNVHKLVVRALQMAVLSKRRVKLLQGTAISTVSAIIIKKPLNLDVVNSFIDVYLYGM